MMRPAMRGLIAPTDHDWYRFLATRPQAEEVDFWRPGGANFAALRPGEPWFFKLKAPHHAIGGFGLFARFARLPVWRAWDLFGEGNGAVDEWDLVRRLQRLLGGGRTGEGLNRVIGCAVIAQPVFFPPDEWVAPPADWARQIVSGRTYDLSHGEGRRVWLECLERAAARSHDDWTIEAFALQRSGRPQVITPRLGQGAFRLAVLEAYGNQCAITTEHSLPVLDAAHIRPWAAGGHHAVPNGVPLRRDLHRLFDLGYVTIRPDHRFAVSSSLRDEYANGRAYYALDGRAVHVPADRAAQPDPELLAWHEAEIFRGS